MSTHRLVLLGDSILDNRPYTMPAPDTTTHLVRLLGRDWTVELLARDGAVMADVPHQLRRLEGGPDVAILSMGGNDVTEHIGLLERRSTTAARVLDELLRIADDFERRYEAIAREVADRAARTVLCTIYEVRLEPPEYARLARVPLGVLNDRIIGVGARLGLDVLELRSVCTEPSDFVFQVEPSAQGAEKIAGAIARVVQPPALESGRVYAAWRRPSFS